eukprot:Awhi_evm1s6250
MRTRADSKTVGFNNTFLLQGPESISSGYDLKITSTVSSAEKAELLQLNILDEEVDVGLAIAEVQENTELSLKEKQKKLSIIEEEENATILHLLSSINEEENADSARGSSIPPKTKGNHYEQTKPETSNTFFKSSTALSGKSSRIPKRGNFSFYVYPSSFNNDNDYSYDFNAVANSKDSMFSLCLERNQNELPLEATLYTIMKIRPCKGMRKSSTKKVTGADREVTKL